MPAQTVRLQISWTRLLVARCALRRRAIRAVAGHAITHVECAYLQNLAHVLNVAVAGRAAEARRDVRLVNEADMVRHAVDPLPVNRLLLYPGGAQLADLLSGLSDGPFLWL